MGVLEVRSPIKQNVEADAAAHTALVNLQAQLRDVAPVVPVYDAQGVQTNLPDRVETLVVDAPTFEIRTFSDGTVRKDNRAPSPVTPAVVRDGTYQYNAEDQARLSNSDGRIFLRVCPTGLEK